MTLQSNSLFANNEINLDDDGYQGFQGQNLNTSATITITLSAGGVQTGSMYDFIDEDKTTFLQIVDSGSHTARNNDIVFDLGKSIKIRDIKFHYDLALDGGSGMTLSKSKDNTTWTTINTDATTGTGIDKSLGDNRARYLRLRINDTGNLTFKLYRFDIYK